MSGLLYRCAKGRMPRRTALALAALLVAAACTSVPSSSSIPVWTPVPSIPGTAGHFDDGEMSFDYPTDWPVLTARVPESCGDIYVLLVLGSGSWSEGANQPQSGGAVLCGIDSVTVAPGGAVVRIYWRSGGPAPMCEGNTQANATVGPNAVQKVLDGSVTSWEVRLPGGEFGMANDPIIEVHTSNPTLLAKAEAVVASFRWGPGATSYAGLCSPSPAITAAI